MSPFEAIARYRKAIATAIGTILTWAEVAYVPDGNVDRLEWYGLAIALATVAGVIGVPNAPQEHL